MALCWLVISLEGQVVKMAQNLLSSGHYENQGSHRAVLIGWGKKSASK
jgi:hypothetical protein